MARPQKSAKGKVRAAPAAPPAPTARGKAKNGKPHSAGPTRKRPRIDDDQQHNDLEDEGEEDEAGVNGVQGNMDSDLDSDAEEALAYFGEDLDSDEDLPAIIDEDDDDDDESDLDSEDDDEDISDISDDDADSDKEDDDAREDRYAARVSRLSKRTEIQKTEEDDRQSRKRLPVRGLAGDWNEDAHSSSEEEDEEDDDEEDEEGKALAAAYDEAASTVAPTLPSTSGAKNRAIHNDRVLDKLRSEQAQRAAEAAAEEASDHRVLSAKARKAESAASAVASNSLLLGNRFGMMAPYAVMMLPKRSLRIHQAREQIAHLSQNIVNDPEVGLAHLRRLLVFAGRDVLAPLKTPTGQIGDGEEEGAFEDEDGAATLSNKKRKREMWKRKQQMKKKANGADQDGQEDDDDEDDDDDLEAGLPARARADIDPPIRQLAMLSLMAVFSDIIPGYRIRALTEEEKAQKTTQDVSRRRDWEEGLLKSYREFLELCEQAIKARAELSSTALHALCHILTRATHFNYRQNLLRLIIARLSHISSPSFFRSSSSLVLQLSPSGFGGSVRLFLSFSKL
ncbi:hypothetical protein CF326_g3232 [Tilletia indica]|nr:hypothetical protein CF326_g3232 [Tilletia indica]